VLPGRCYSSNKSRCLVGLHWASVLEIEKQTDPIAKSASRRRALVLASALIAVASMSRPASAALGGNVSSVDVDRVQAQGALLRLVSSDAYTLHEFQTASGVTVREYVSPSGTVFGVTWQGPWLPDLQQLLGPYYGRFQQRAQQLQQSRKSRGPLTIQDDDLVIQTSGHQRAFSGRAYLPGSMPRGLNTQSIK
jgi:hypothetical protein